MLELIETLWNVNIIEKGFVKLVGMRINRNIVECKCDGAIEEAKPKRELIETLWNVNFFVKNATFATLRINRNIVECKLKIIGILFKPILRINRNIVECKLD